MNAAHEQLNRCLGQLAEHFDSVLILVSYNEEGFTRAAVKRAGNFYACKGLAQEFIEEEQQKDAAFHLAEKLRENTDL